MPHPVNGIIPGMVVGPMNAPPPVPQLPPGVGFLNAQGINTSSMSAGQVQNALMDAINGKQRGSFGAGNSN